MAGAAEEGIEATCMGWEWVATNESRRKADWNVDDVRGAWREKDDYEGTNALR